MSENCTSGANSASSSLAPSFAPGQQQLQQLDPVHLALLVVTPALVAFGVAANAINIVVLTRRWMSSSTNNYLTALAVADTVYLLVFYVITIKFYPGVQSQAWFAHLLSYLFPLANLLSNYATWLTCLFTFERWLVIYKPMFGRKHCTKERAKHLICGMFAATALFTFPNFFEYRAVRKETLSAACENVTVKSVTYVLGSTEAYGVVKSLGYYHLFVFIFVFGPLAFLVVFNGLLIHSVVLARRRRAAMESGGCATGGSDADSHNQQHQQHQPLQKRSSKASSEQQKVTIMLIAVVLVFCLCQLPSAVMTLRKAMQSEEEKSAGGRRANLASRIASSLVNILLLMNAACNFVLYSCFSTRFRDTFRRVFLRCGAGRGGGGIGRGGGGGGRCGGGGGSGGRGCGAQMELHSANPSPGNSQANLHHQSTAQAAADRYMRGICDRSSLDRHDLGGADGFGNCEKFDDNDDRL